MITELSKSLVRRMADIRAHPFVALALLASAAWIVVTASDTAKTCVYLAACVACVFAADVLTKRPADGLRGTTTACEPRLPVAQPRTELGVLTALMLVGALGVLVPSGLLGNVTGLVRFVLLISGLVCLFQVVPAVWLVVRGYRAAGLGFRWTGASIGLVCTAVVAASALAVDPDGSPVVMVARAGAWAELLVLLTTLPQVFAEEFMRMTLQTRIAAMTRNAAFGWFVATLPWALLHVPMWMAGGDSLEGALGGALRIVPIGLFWGFLTWRTGSLVPALIAHSLNIWGLQNP